MVPISDDIAAAAGEINGARGVDAIIHAEVPASAAATIDRGGALEKDPTGARGVFFAIIKRTLAVACAVDGWLEPGFNCEHTGVECRVEIETRGHSAIS